MSAVHVGPGCENHKHGADSGPETHASAQAEEPKNCPAGPLILSHSATQELHNSRRVRTLTLCAGLGHGRSVSFLHPSSSPCCSSSSSTFLYTACYLSTKSDVLQCPHLHNCHLCPNPFSSSPGPRVFSSLCRPSATPRQPGRPQPSRAAEDCHGTVTGSYCLWVSFPYTLSLLFL